MLHLYGLYYAASIPTDHFGPNHIKLPKYRKNAGICCSEERKAPGNGLTPESHVFILPAGGNSLLHYSWSFHLVH